MSEQPFEFEFEISTFDLSLLPIDLDVLRSNRDLLEGAVEDFYGEMFSKMGGEATISRSRGIIKVRWLAEGGAKGLLKAGLDFLEHGDPGSALPLLQGVLLADPDNTTALYNLGMLYSDLGKIEDSINLLEHLLDIDSEFCRAWVALGVAYSRCGKTKEAIHALEKSVELDPADPYALRNLGGLLAKKSPSEALPYLKKASNLLPDDQAALYGYGLALYQTDSISEADKILKQSVQINPLTNIAEEARKIRTQIAHDQMRGNVGGGLRMDAVMYCLAAIQKFKAEPESISTVTMEISMLGRGGLDINDPTQKYTLRSMDGDFSGLQLVSYMFVGLRQLAPELDPGIDLSKEYQEALKLSDLG